MQNIDVLLVTETHFTERSAISIPQYNIYTTNHPDGTAHGGTAVLIKATIKHHQLPSFKTEHIQATTVCIEEKNGSFNVSSIYSPPKHKIKEWQYKEYFGTLGRHFIAGGDWNAKNMDWRSRLIKREGAKVLPRKK